MQSAPIAEQKIPKISAIGALIVPTRFIYNKKKNQKNLEGFEMKVSAIKQKQRYQAKQPYTPEQRLNLKKCGCDPQGAYVPRWLLDKIADEKFSAGYNIRRSNQCETCFEYKSANGSCSCS
jgi:hypothetical protein